MLAVAVEAEVDRAVLIVARRSLAEGDEAIEAGDFTGGAGAFGDALASASDPLIFDIDVFEGNVRAALDGQTVGHAWVIARNGQLYGSDADGVARRAVDNPGGSATPQSVGSTLQPGLAPDPGVAGDPGSDYTNANFALLRVLIPRIAYGDAVISFFTDAGYPLDAVYAGLYEHYVSTNTLAPADVARSDHGD